MPKTIRPVALATHAGLANGAEDDLELVRALGDLGLEAVPAVWSDPAVRWSEYSAVVVRSTWDYHLRYREFLDWVRVVGETGRLWNPPELVRWNSHKSYLLELERHGVPVAPTRLCDDLPSALRRAEAEGWSEVVVKPAVSAGAYRTYRFPLAGVQPGRPPWGDAPPEGQVLVQPYLTEVEGAGERSLVFLGGSFSHAFLRAPHWGGGSGLVEGTRLPPTEAEVALARRTVACAPGEPLFARVDLVTDARGRSRIMELELIEPYLALRSAPGSAAAFARAVAGRLGR